MSENEKNVPKRRFKEFYNAEAWEQRKLGEYSKLITKGTTPKDKGNEGQVTFVKVENLSNGKINSKSKITIQEHENYLKRSKLEENDVLFSIAGTLGRTALVDKSILPANTNQALAIIRGYDFDTNFLLTSLIGKVVKDFVRKNPTIGAQPNLSLEQVGNLIIWTPQKQEQQKIGTFFKKIDDTITLHQRKLEKMKVLKKAYLTDMFPAEGERKPKLRFSGFTDDWEQRKLSEETNSIDTGKSKFVTKAGGQYEILGSTSVIGYDDSYDYEGDFLLTARVGANAGELYRHSGKVKISDNTVFIQGENLDFIYYMLMNFDIKRLSFGTGQPLVKASELKKLKLMLPKQNEERVLIGDYFHNLDNLITLHQYKLEKLQNIKKAYVNEMFI